MNAGIGEGNFSNPLDKAGAGLHAADEDGEVYKGIIRTERRNCVAQTGGGFRCDFYDIDLYMVRKNGSWSSEERERLTIKGGHSDKGDTVL